MKRYEPGLEQQVIAVTVSTDWRYVAASKYGGKVETTTHHPFRQ